MVANKLTEIRKVPASNCKAGLQPLGVKCGCNQAASVINEDGLTDYPLDPVPNRGAPTSLAELAAWLNKHSPSGGSFGKIYVATTISWDQKAGIFRQGGCSPNYKAGWWTLACCKHEMRRSTKLKGILNHSDSSLFIFTLAKKSTVLSSEAQVLVSVAKVTMHFTQMVDYAKFILKSGNRALVSSHLSRERIDDGCYGWRFGDCHADKVGEVGRPQSGHVHGENNNWEADANMDGNPPHEILISNEFLVWERPCFESVEMIKQARYGRNVTNLKAMLKAIPN